MNQLSFVQEFYKKNPLKTIFYNGKSWEYIVSGKGETTFLIFPGAGQNAQVNCNFIQSFSQRYTVIVPSIYINYPSSVDEVCVVIDAILLKEQTKEFVAYGLSLGGLLVQSYVKRNKKNNKGMIISQACAPTSKFYKQKIIFSLYILRILLPCIPDSVIKYAARKWAGLVQGKSKKMNTKNKDALYLFFTNEFKEKYFSKKLIQSWINLHMDFYHHEKFIKKDFESKPILILNSDNDPLMQDSGEFAKIYPHAKRHTFHGVGHLAFYYAFDEIVQVIQRFLSSLDI